MKRFAWLLGLAMLGSVAAADLNKVLPPAEPAALEITYKPVPLNRENPKQTRVGELVYRGGLELRSHNKDFGGISGMRLWNNDTVLAVSDAGSWISFKLIEKKGRLVGVKGIAIAPILDKDGKAGVKAKRDAEAVAIDASGYTIVTFEGQNAEWIFNRINPAEPDTFLHPASEIFYPDYMKLWPKNGGPEAFDYQVFYRDQAKYLTLAEDAFDADGTTAGYFVYPTEQPFRYRPPAGFKPTDTMLVDEEHALVLHRKFSPASGVAASIGFFDILTSDSSHEIARLAPPLTVDNMEGISYVERRGRRYIYIISDDNFSGLQRTLLMKFEWVRKK